MFAWEMIALEFVNGRFRLMRDVDKALRPCGSGESRGPCNPSRCLPHTQTLSELCFFPWEAPIS